MKHRSSALAASVPTYIVVSIVIIVVGTFVWSRFARSVLDRQQPIVSKLPPGPVPEFTLTESHGQPLTRADLLGKIWVANLMFTSCPSTCPTLSATMSKLDRALGPRDDVRLVSITITPEYDQPAVLRQYAEGFKASDKWLFLTGERAQIVKLANEGFWMSAGTPGTVTHSDNFVLVDREGKVRGFFDGTKLENADTIAAEVEKLSAAR